jgi:hypothetical protein
MIDKESPNIVLERFKILLLRSSADKLYRAVCKMDKGESESVSLRSSGDSQYPHMLEIINL